MMEMLKEQETDDAPVTTQEDMSPSQSDLHAFNDFPDGDPTVISEEFEPLPYNSSDGLNYSPV